MIGYRFMPLFKDISDRSENAYLRWTERHRPWGSSWESTVREAVIFEPRWVKGSLLWLYSNKMNPGKRWLLELLDNGEDHLQLLQAMHAARWVEEHKKKGQKHERANAKQT